MVNAIPTAIEKLQQAWNAHDADALRGCLHMDYESVQPLHPERNLRGRESAVRGWAHLFEAVPDLRAELLHWTTRDDQVWTEWRWSGSHVSGCAFCAGGVMVFGLRDEQIARARVYTETISASGPDWEAVLGEIMSQKHPDN